jgi:hypothetical protein
VVFPAASPLSRSVTFGSDLVLSVSPKGNAILVREFGICLSFPWVVAAPPRYLVLWGFFVDEFWASVMVLGLTALVPHTTVVKFELATVVVFHSPLEGWFSDLGLWCCRSVSAIQNKKSMSLLLWVLGCSGWPWIVHGRSWVALP